MEIPYGVPLPPPRKCAKIYEGFDRVFCTFLRRGGGPPLRECANLAWLEKLYTTILYSTGVKVVVNTTVGQLGAVGIRGYYQYQAAGWTQ